MKKNIYPIITALSVGFILERYERLFFVMPMGLIHTGMLAEFIAALGFLGLIVLTYSLLKGNFMLGYLLAAVGGIGLMVSSLAWHILRARLNTSLTAPILTLQIIIFFIIIQCLIRLRKAFRVN